MPCTTDTCNTKYVPNLTLALDEGLLKRARKRAIDDGTSVNALVRDYLSAYAEVTAPTRSLVADLRSEIVALARRHRGRSIALIGSAARGDDGPDSDLDFLVEFEPGSSLFDQARLQDDLEALLGKPVDIVSAGGLKPRDEAVRRDAIVL